METFYPFFVSKPLFVFNETLFFIIELKNNLHESHLNFNFEHGQKTEILRCMGR